jgi:hypothetical protein
MILLKGCELVLEKNQLIGLNQFFPTLLSLHNNNNNENLDVDMYMYVYTYVGI